MRQYSKHKISFKIVPKLVPKIRIDDRSQLTQLGKAAKFTYDFKFNQKRTKVKLSLSTVNVLKGQLGVYADQPIKASNRTIGCYAGKRVPVGKESVDSYYIFEISNHNHEIIEYIDGEKLRDWTNFVNHSVTPNLDAHQRKINGKINICFYAARPIRKGEQLLFDYGKAYFTSLKNYYIHPTDNWQTAAQHYMQKQRFYLPGTYIFDRQLNQDLGLKNLEWLIPAAFFSIYHNDKRHLARILQKNYPIDLLAYALNTKHEIAATHSQQHMTALMFACYLGVENCIDLLLQYNPDVNRCMLITGYSAFILLCKGRAKDAVVNRIGKKLLKKMHFPLVIDKDKKSILHYAITRGDHELVKQIIRMMMREDDEKALAKVLNRADIIYCLKQKYFTILKLLFKALKDHDLPKPRIPAMLTNRLTKKEKIEFQKALAMPFETVALRPPQGER